MDNLPLSNGFRKHPRFTESFRYLKWGTEPYKAILEVGFPLHKPYIQLTKVSTSILDTWNVCWQVVVWDFFHQQYQRHHCLLGLFISQTRCFLMRKDKTINHKRVMQNHQTIGCAQPTKNAINHRMVRCWFGAFRWFGFPGSPQNERDLPGPLVEYTPED